ncbi:MAG: host-nuclease inhibitor Gam family protein [Opitutales bacterium]
MAAKKKSKRARVAVTGTREEFERDVNRIAQLQVLEAKAVATRDAESEAVLKKWNPQIEGLQAEMEPLLKRAAAFAQAHREELFDAGLRSGGTQLAIVGFRMGQPEVVKARGVKPTLEQLAETLQQEGYADCVTVKYTVDKSGIKKRLQNGCKRIAEIFRIRQTERFYVESKAQQQRDD